MKSITRLSLALIMFSLFSISYLVTSVSAQTGVNPGMRADHHDEPPVVGDISHCDAFSGPALAACVDAAHGSAPAPFDDGLMGAPAAGAPGTMGNATGAGGPCAQFAPATQSHESCMHAQQLDANDTSADVDHCSDFAPGTPPHQSCVQRQHGGR